MFRWLLLIALVACYAPRFPTGAPCATGDVCPGDLVCSPTTHTCETSISDAAVDTRSNHDGSVGMLDGAIGPACYGAGIVTVCLQQQPTGSLAVTADTLTDTAGSATCTEVVDGYCVIAHQQIRVDAGTLRATGSRPLVLIGTSSISIAGTLDVASRRSPAFRGAGSNPAGCPTGMGNSSPGGAGGSFGGRGGGGGDGLTGSGAASAMVATPTALRGGCDGRTASQPGGAGGGAVFLISQGVITVSGTITASGAGGTGGMGSNNGAGGGGAGGMIGLDAPTVTTTGTAAIFANGGGGGRGGAADGNGQSGADATVALSAAAGGTGGTSIGGSGGSGSSGTNKGGGNGGNAVAGGGGGGGGAGVIKVVPLQSLSGAISPPPS